MTGGRAFKKNKADADGDAARHHLIDAHYQSRLPKFDDIEAPLLSAANWGGMGLHPRGNFEGYLRAGSKQKWLEVHGDTHFTLFYAELRPGSYRSSFYDRFPQRSSTTAADKQPKVLLQLFAIPTRSSCRAPRTDGRSPAHQWTKFPPRSGQPRVLSKAMAAQRRNHRSPYAHHRRRPHLLDAADHPEPLETSPDPVAAKLFRLVGHHRRRSLPGAARVRRSGRQGGRRSSARTTRARLASISAGCAPRAPSSSTPR